MTIDTDPLAGVLGARSICAVLRSMKRGLTVLAGGRMAEAGYGGMPQPVGASNLVAGDTNGTFDVFVRQRR